MNEPLLAEFRALVRRGASAQDIHDAAEPVGYAEAGSADTGSFFVEREVRRVETHRASLVPVLEHFIAQAPAILDVGCGSGGTTVALALSESLRAYKVVGVDPNPAALEAARVRARAHDVESSRIQFDAIIPREPLPYADGQFDLVTCVSVLEFISEQSTRAGLASEIQRVTRPGGYIFLATPSPWRVREFHSRRVLGNFFHRAGYPWSSTPLAIRRMFDRCERIPVSAFVVRDILQRRGLPAADLLSLLSPLMGACLPWQKHFFRKRA